MIEGHPPFQEPQIDKLYQKILNDAPAFSSYFSAEAKSLIE